MLRAGLAAIVVLAVAQVGFAQTSPSKPRLPPGRDPGGAMLGLITTGIDPTVPAVARCLARDGEGELIGWDMIDRSRVPFRPIDPVAAGDEALFAGLPCDGRVRVSPVRVDPSDPVTLDKALAFFTTTSARVVVLAPSARPVDWAPVRHAAAEFGQLTVIVVGEPLPADVVMPPNLVVLPGDAAMPHAIRVLLCATPSATPATDSACR